jgi:hypothetical protein
MEKQEEYQVEPFAHCPACGHELNYFSGLVDNCGYIPSYLFCPVCNDVAYTDDGEKLADLV